MIKNDIYFNHHNFNNIVIDILIFYYGVLQFIHIIALIIAGIIYYSKGSISFLAPPSTAGWSNQAVDFFIIMGIGDAFNAGLSLVFVYTFFKNYRKTRCLGLIVLSISIYSAIIYMFPVIMSGAFVENIIFYITIIILFLPIIVLYYLLIKTLL